MEAIDRMKVNVYVRFVHMTADSQDHGGLSFEIFHQNKATGPTE
jgi:hypothetical protein